MDNKRQNDHPKERGHYISGYRCYPTTKIVRPLIFQNEIYEDDDGEMILPAATVLYLISSIFRR